MSAQPVPLPLPVDAHHPRVIGARKFLADFKPLESIIDGLPTPRGGIVSITGPTGSGKTTICTAVQLALRTGRPFAGRQVTQGSVLVLAGENPDDYAMHLLASTQHEGIDPESLSSPIEDTNLCVIPGTFDVLASVDHIDHVISGQMENLVAVFVDTSAAFYQGDDENDNVAMRRHASILRELATLPGKPTVFVLCHPVKHATKDNLIPRGGGAFLAEVDANLTVWKDDAEIITVHWAGKIRGAPFEPIRFELVKVELAGKVDCRGNPIFSTAARHLGDERADQLLAKAIDDEDRLLIAMQKKPRASVRDLGMACGWTNGVGKPNVSRVNRRLHRLKELGLAEQERKGTWRLTTKGQKEADQLP